MVTTETGEIVSTSHNRAVTFSYEPASVLKAMTFASVINEGLGVGTSKRDIPDTVILEWENNEGNTETEITSDEYEYETQEMSIEGILTHSSNTGTIVWAQELGQQKLYDYLRKFGFGQASGLEFPYESQGILHDLNKWDPIKLEYYCFRAWDIGNSNPASKRLFCNSKRRDIRGSTTCKPYC